MKTCSHNWRLWSNFPFYEWKCDNCEVVTTEDPDKNPAVYFDSAVEAELKNVSQLEYNSHEICKHFASNLRRRLFPKADS